MCFKISGENNWGFFGVNMKNEIGAKHLIFRKWTLTCEIQQQLACEEPTQDSKMRAQFVAQKFNSFCVNGERWSDIPAIFVPRRRNDFDIARDEVQGICADDDLVCLPHGDHQHKGEYLQESFVYLHQELFTSTWASTVSVSGFSIRPMLCDELTWATNL